MYADTLTKVIIVEVPVKIIPELFAARHLLVQFASRNGFIAEFLLEALEGTETLFSLILLFASSWKKRKRILCTLSPG